MDEEITVLSWAIILEYYHIQKDDNLFGRLIDLAGTSGNASAEFFARLHTSYFACYFPESTAEARLAQRNIDAALFRAEQMRDYPAIALALMARARAVFDEGRWRECEEDLRRGGRLWPELRNSTPVRLRGLIATEHGEQDKYTVIINTCLASDPSPESNISAAVELAWLIAWSALLRGDTQHVGRARELCKAVLEHGRTDRVITWRALVGLGLTSAAAGKKKEAAAVQDCIVAFEERNERTKWSNCLLRAVIADAAGDPQRAGQLCRSEFEQTQATGNRVAMVWTGLFFARMAFRKEGSGMPKSARRRLSDSLAEAGRIGMSVSAASLVKLTEEIRRADEACAVVLPHGLSAREAEVLPHIALGKTNQEISRDLYISEHTVAHHTSHIFAKIGVDNRTSAAAFAVRTGLSRLQNQ